MTPIRLHRPPASPSDVRLAGGDDDERERRTRRDGGVILEERKEVKKPPMFKVLIHNDDYTPMEFVVAILMAVFHHSEAEATRIMLHVHRTGIGVAGVFTRQIAETKRAKVVALAQAAEFPLQSTVEEA